MSSAVTESDTFSSAVTVPGTNDVDYYVSVPQMGTDLANRTRHLTNTLMGTASGSSEFLADADVTAHDSTSLLVPAASRANLIRISLAGLLGRILFQRTRITNLSSTVWGAPGAAAKSMNVPIAPTYIGAVPPAFSSFLSSNILSWRQEDVSGSAFFIWPIHGLPPTGQITALQMQVKGSGHGALPATMPKVELWRQNIDSTTLVASATDASASVGAYEALHAIQNISIAEDISATYNYFVRFTGESGANSVVNGLNIYRCQVAIGPTS
jgi:hypothetical protein